MVKYTVKTLPSSKYSIKAPYSMNAKGITLHNTYNDAAAINEISYMQGNNNQVSFHIAVDGKGAIEGAPLNRNAWHAGDGGNGYGNRNHIGIEICYSKSGGARYDEAETKAIKLTAQMLKERNWDINKVKKHQDWSGKNCPHRILARSRGWQGIINAIQNELDKLGGKKTSKTRPKPNKKPVSNGSVVDYLNTNKINSSYANRKKLAAKHGISNYKGTASQNVVLLNKLQGGSNKVSKPSARKANLKVDGYWGAATTRALQRYYGTPQDGIISKPSLVIRKLQGTLKVKADGYLGPVTIRAMQRRFGTPIDGILSKPSVAIKELQRRLNRGKL